MKCTTILSEDREEVLIYASKRRSLIEEIEKLCLNDCVEIVGYKNKEIVKLFPSDIYCFIVEENKIFAKTNDETFQIKQRIYQLEEILDDSFIKINQSCIVNLKKVKSFNVSFMGAMMVTLKNGYQDYVSRRQVKIVKERFGI